MSGSYFQGVIAFFSVDLVESASFKATVQNDADLPDDWVQVIFDFFEQFPLMLASRAADAGLELASPYDNVWKRLGDEIVFAYDVTAWDDLHKLCLAFYQTLQRFDREQVDKQRPRLKGHAWIAQFPYPNRRLILNGREDLPDYLGPGIDVGFRLAQHSRPGRFLISLDLAERLALLSMERLPRSPAVRDFVFHRVGWARLKGVQVDLPYPILWLRAPEDSPKPEMPWDEHLCDLTRQFLDRASMLDSMEIVRFVDEMRTSLRRKSLNRLDPFRPYLASETPHREHQPHLERIRQQYDEERQEVELDLPDDDQNEALREDPPS